MLAAGAVTCVITFIERCSVLTKLVSLFVVMLLFYILSRAFIGLFDYFDAENEKRRQEEENVIEKEAEDQEEAAGEEPQESEGTEE